MRQIKSMNLPVPTKEPLSIRVTFFENATDVLTDDVGIEFADVTPPQFGSGTPALVAVDDQAVTFTVRVSEPCTFFFVVRVGRRRLCSARVCVAPCSPPRRVLSHALYRSSTPVLRCLRQQPL